MAKRGRPRKRFSSKPRPVEKDLCQLAAHLVISMKMRRPGILPGRTGPIYLTLPGDVADIVDELNWQLLQAGHMKTYHDDGKTGGI